MLPQSFYARDASVVARELLGTILVHKAPTGMICGRIVETEAYLGAQDPAAHSYRGETPRTRVMFGEAGHAYVYFTYGMHYCFNVVAGSKNGQAVLIRALEPIKGLELMQVYRKQANIRNLCNGPAKLVQALGITKEHNGHNLTQEPLWIEQGESIKEERVVTTTRIGISKAADLLLRFYIADNPYISKP